jgi:hypothetical protein
LSDKSFIQQDNPALNNTERQDIAEGTDFTKIPHNQNRTYSTMLKLICGALVRGTKYCDVYMASDMGEDYGSTTKMVANNITVLTLQEVARKVACLEKCNLMKNSTYRMK